MHDEETGQAPQPSEVEVGSPPIVGGPVPAGASDANHDTLKYHLLGPSLTKAGQDSVDQQKVCDEKAPAEGQKI